MPTLITDPELERRLHAERAASGADRYDEVWQGICMMARMPNVEHQDMVNGFAAVFQEIVRWAGLGMVMPGANVSDREDGWEVNYRVPDVAVFLDVGHAKNCDTHWCGGPDFVVEIVSKNDRTRDKLPFYAEIGVRELLIVDRHPWQLELLRLERQQWISAGLCDVGQLPALTSEVLPLCFSLSPGTPRPGVHIEGMDHQKHWIV